MRRGIGSRLTSLLQKNRRVGPWSTIATHPITPASNEASTCAPATAAPLMLTPNAGEAREEICHRRQETIESRGWALR